MSGTNAFAGEEGRVYQVCAEASEREAADLVLREGSVALIRTHGEWTALEEFVVTTETLEALRRLTRVPAEARDFDSRLVCPDGSRFRVNLNRAMGRDGAVLRRIRSSVPALEDLGLPHELLRDWLERSSGIILLSGRTGSGKSTTLAACLEWINSVASRHIVTIEDPVEYLFQTGCSFFTQREVGSDTSSFGEGLRRAMRQSPDIIMVGEIRDEETAVAALQAAETGHLVLSTVHGASCVEALQRLNQLVPETRRDFLRSSLSETLIGILCQRLLPALQGGLALATEALSGEGVVVRLIVEDRLNEVEDHLNRNSSDRCWSLNSSLHRLRQEERIDEAAALAASPNRSELQRLFRGIQSGGVAANRKT